jgi:hypothetical protein
MVLARRRRAMTPEDSIFLLFFVAATIFIAGGMWYGDKTDKTSKRNK